MWVGGRVGVGGWVFDVLTCKDVSGWVFHQHVEQAQQCASFTDMAFTRAGTTRRRVLLPCPRVCGRRSCRCVLRAWTSGRPRGRRRRWASPTRPPRARPPPPPRRPRTFPRTTICEHPSTTTSCAHTRIFKTRIAKSCTHPRSAISTHVHTHVQIHVHSYTHTVCVCISVGCIKQCVCVCIAGEIRWCPFVRTYQG